TTSRPQAAAVTTGLAGSRARTRVPATAWASGPSAPAAPRTFKNDGEFIAFAEAGHRIKSALSPAAAIPKRVNDEAAALKAKYGEKNISIYQTQSGNQLRYVIEAAPPKGQTKPGEKKPPDPVAKLYDGTGKLLASGRRDNTHFEWS